jgi:hypothetical protein
LNIFALFGLDSIAAIGIGIAIIIIIHHSSLIIARLPSTSPHWMFAALRLGECVRVMSRRLHLRRQGWLARCS